MRSLQLCLLAVVLILALHEALASAYKDEVDKAAAVGEKILVGKEDPEDTKTLESALKISNEDGNIRLKFWFQGDDDNEVGESDFDSDNYDAVTLDDGDDGDGDDDERERSEGHHSPYSSESRRRFYRRRPPPFDEEEGEEEEDDERYRGHRCTRFGCFGGYRYGSYDDDEEYANDLWRDYRRRRSLDGRRRRLFLGDNEDDDTDERGGDD
ncbi:unnamed protein product [Taenia asiatica]|uniref:Expressed conserved protein n=1 Tax=Taenia asiatica TaxID=60517 RepID=A0A0R3VW12_TAEAS|nr:unnamed protein product [Taenia asiatica]